MKTQALLAASQTTDNMTNQLLPSSISTDCVQSSLLPSQYTIHHEHPSEYSHENTMMKSVTGTFGALVLLYGFVCLDDIRDVDEQTEALSNVRDLMNPFGGVETGMYEGGDGVVVAVVVVASVVVVVAFTATSIMMTASTTAITIAAATPTNTSLCDLSHP